MFFRNLQVQRLDRAMAVELGDIEELPVILQRILVSVRLMTMAMRITLPHLDLNIRVMTDIIRRLPMSYFLTHPVHVRRQVVWKMMIVVVL